MGAVLFCGDGAVLSHRSAAALWGMRGHGSHAIEVTVPRKSRSRGSVHRHFAVLPADEVTEHDGLPVTTVPRTLLDLAGASSASATRSVDTVEQALRQSERLRLYDALSLEDLLKRYPRRPGSRVLRECLRRRRELPNGVTREELEARFLAFLRRRRLPRPRLNAWLDLGSRRFQADCLWTRERLIVELDSHQSHDTWSSFESDRDRDRRLLAAGYRTMRVTWRQLHDIPGEVAADLRALLNPQAPAR